jgi:hypothetical protein
MRFRSARALAHGAAIAQDDDVRIEVAAEDADCLAIGRPREAAATLFGRLPDWSSVHDIFSRDIRMRMGGMTSL